MIVVSHFDWQTQIHFHSRFPVVGPFSILILHILKGNIITCLLLLLHNSRFCQTKILSPYQSHVFVLVLTKPTSPQIKPSPIILYCVTKHGRWCRNNCTTSVHVSNKPRLVQRSCHTLNRPNLWQILHWKMASCRQFNLPCHNAEASWHFYGA